MRRTGGRGLRAEGEARGAGAGCRRRGPGKTALCGHAGSRRGPPFLNDSKAFSGKKGNSDKAQSRTVGNLYCKNKKIKSTKIISSFGQLLIGIHAHTHLASVKRHSTCGPARGGIRSPPGDLVGYLSEPAGARQSRWVGEGQAWQRPESPRWDGNAFLSSPSPSCAHRLLVFRRLGNGPLFTHRTRPRAPENRHGAPAAL